MRIKLDDYLNSHLRKNSLAIVAIVLLNMIAILTLKFYETNKQSDRFKLSVLNTLSKSIVENDIIQIKNISKGLSEANPNFDLCVKYNGTLLFGNQCSLVKYDQYTLPLRKEKLLLYTSNKFVDFDLLAYAVSIFLIVALLLMLRKNIFKHNELIKNDLKTLGGDQNSELLFEEFSLVEETLRKIEAFRLENEKLSMKNIISKQVAHDIRSPLSALELVMEDIKSLPEDSRELTVHAINRIQDIANNLSKDGEVKKSDKASYCLPSITIGNVVNEKKIEYQNLDGISISFYDESSKCNFVKVSEGDLARVISNLVNNAVESLGDRGKIDISIFEKNEGLSLLIQDNGSGFPESILAGPITRGNSVGKEAGQGLGLHHAFESIKKMGGSLELSNKSVGETGAVIEITLPLSESPEWFKDKISLSDVKRAVIIDDDKSIHDVWKKIIKQNDPTLPIKDLFTAQEISKELGELKGDEFVLIDYDLRQDKTGLDYIQEFNLDKVALVTSNYDDEEVVNYCTEHGIQLIPKQVVSAIQIR